MSNTYSEFEATRQMVLHALEASPAHGRTEYGIFFYGDFADHPERYGLDQDLLRRLQQRALMITVLNNWYDLERGLSTPLDVKMAAQTAYQWLRPNKDTPSAFRFNEKDLKNLGIELETFRRLVDALLITAIHRYETTTDANIPQSTDTDWMTMAKIHLGYPASAPIDYNQAMANIGYMPDDNPHPMPIRELIIHILYAPGGSFRDQDAGISDLTMPIAKSWGYIPTILRSIRLAENERPKKDRLQQPMREDGNVLIFPKKFPAVDYLRKLERLEDYRIGSIFNHPVSRGAESANYLFHELRVAQVDPPHFGFKAHDEEKLKNLPKLSDAMDALRNLRRDEDARYIAVTGWLRSNPFNDHVMDELGISRALSGILIRAAGMDLMIQSSEYLSQGGKIRNIDYLLFNALTTPNTSNADVLELVKYQPEYADTTVQAILKMPWQEQMADELGVKSLDEIAARFDHLPAHNALVRDWFPDMNARILAAAGMKPNLLPQGGKPTPS